MRVSFASDVLYEEGAWDVLDRIVFFFIDGRHLWDVSNIDEIEESPWLKTDPQGRSATRSVEILRKSFTQSAYPPETRTHQIRICITFKVVDVEWDLPPVDAWAVLNSPVLVFVENAESDGAFLDAMLYAFGRDAVIEAKNSGWLQVVQLGGFGEVEKSVARVISRAIRPSRVVVMTDSDREYPGHITDTIRKVESYCIPNQVPYFILMKRKIENYLPVNVLPRGRRYHAYLRLSGPQRSHYEMKNGFRINERGRAVVPDSQVPLYANVPQGVLNLLAGGFGKKISERFRTYLSEISADGVRLTCDDDPQEIERLLNLIESTL